MLLQKTTSGEHKMERDAHERWLQLSQEQQSVILAAAKEKGFTFTFLSI